MRISNIVNGTVLAAGLYLASAPSYADDIWLFTITSDQSGPTCYAIDSTPCSITSHESPYTLGTLTISAPVAVYSATGAPPDANGKTPPVIVEFDDKHFMSFAPSAKLTGLAGFNYWPTQPGDVTVSVGVNEVNGNSLSGYLSFLIVGHGSAELLLTGMDNLWTGYYRTWEGPVHQFWARSDKIVAIAQH